MDSPAVKFMIGGLGLIAGLLLVFAGGLFLILDWDVLGVLALLVAISAILYFGWMFRDSLVHDDDEFNLQGLD